MKKRNVFLMSVSMLLAVTVLRSQDYTWQQIDLANPSLLRCAAIGPQDHIYIGNEDEHYLFKSTDLGEHWAECPIFDGYVKTEQPIVRDIEITASGAIYANVDIGYGYYYEDQCGIVRSLDAGVNWEIFVYNTEYHDYWTMTMAPNGYIYISGYDGAAVLYTSGTGKYLGPYWDYSAFRAYGNSNGDCVIGGYQLYVYIDDSWKANPVVNQNSESYNINSLGWVFYGKDGNVFRSKDSGETWEEIYTSSSHVSKIAIDSFNHIYLATSDGVVKSTDNGNTWTTIGLAGKDVSYLDWNTAGNMLAKVCMAGENRLYFGRNNTISGNLVIQLPASAGSELPMLEEFHIEWSSQGNVGNQVKIELYEDHEFKNTIIESTANDGAFDWMVTRHASEDEVYQFKITSLANTDIFAWSYTFNIVKESGMREPKTYTAGRITESFVPAIDGDLDDPIWEHAGEELLDFGGTAGTFNTAWSSWFDARVGWRAVWCGETNRLYVAIEVTDDVQGDFDNGVGDAVYSPANDESIEIMTDGNANGGNYWEFYDAAQYWRVTEENEWNLMNYPTLGEHPYEEDDIVSAVTQGTNGNWICEISMPVYDSYPDMEKVLETGSLIGWEMWYNDSDNQTDKGSYFAMDHQVGWMYWGQSWKYSDFSGDLLLGGYIEVVIPSKTVVVKMEDCDANFSVDTDVYSGMADFNWLMNSTHAVNTTDMYVESAGIRHVFTSWNDGGAQMHTVTVTEESDTLFAYYTPEYYLDLESDHGTLTGEGWYPEATNAGFSVDETVTEDDIQYVFDGWTGGYSGSEASGQIVMNEPKRITASWDTLYQLAVQVENNEGGSVNPSGSSWVNPGALVQVSASPDASGGYEFSGWTGDIISDDNPISFVMDAPKTLTAVFEKGTGVESAALPEEYALYRNFPNPFNPETEISYDMPESGHARIEVFDLMGRKVRTLMNGESSAGSYRVMWNGLDDSGRSVGSGTYIIVMRSGDYEKMMKAVFLK